MVELEKVIETFHTEEGSDLVAEYLKRVFPKDGTDKPSDDWIKMATFKLMECVSENAIFRFHLYGCAMHLQHQQPHGCTRVFVGVGGGEKTAAGCKNKKN